MAELRRLSRVVPKRVDGGARTAARGAARTGWGVYKCPLCARTPLKEEDLQLDHLDPVIPVDKGFTTWDSAIERMFVGVGGYQFICKECHIQKTVRENSGRKR